MPRILVVAVAALVLVACAVSPTGRRQLSFFPEAQMAEMGAAAFAQMQQQVPVSKNAKLDSYVSCVSERIVAELDSGEGERSWEVVVFEDDSANAFALPGGYIGVHSGLLEVARNQDQLATVVAHEIAHVLADHSNERVSTAYATESGLRLAQVLAGGGGPESQSTLMSLLGLGAQFGIILPFSRTQETEADVVGLELMARAGFDPRESVRLWENMSAAAGGEPPEFLSTHPSHGRRIEDLQGNMGEAMRHYQNARAEGRRPQCS